MTVIFTIVLEFPVNRHACTAGGRATALRGWSADGGWRRLRWRCAAQLLGPTDIFGKALDRPDISGGSIAARIRAWSDVCKTVLVLHYYSLAHSVCTLCPSCASSDSSMAVSFSAAVAADRWSAESISSELASTDATASASAHREARATATGTQYYIIAERSAGSSAWRRAGRLSGAGALTRIVCSP